MEHVACNLCGSADARLLYELPDYLLGRPQARASLVRCIVCGLIYQSPRPSPEEMVAHYPPEYDSYHPETADGPGSWLLRRAVQYGLDKRARYVTRRAGGGRLLDIGCSTGLFLNRMKTHGSWELYGVEINRQAAETARQQYGLEVFVGTLEQAGYPDESFDAITLWDVFEHLHDPLRSLHEIHRILKPDGVLVLRVPNGASWDARLFGPHWAGLDAPRHLYVFTPETLRRMLAEAGFAVDELSCRIGSYPTFVLSVRFWLGARGVSARKQRALLKALQHPVARLLSAPLFFLASTGERGPLMVVTASRSRQSRAVSNHHAIGQERARA